MLVLAVSPACSRDVSAETVAERTFLDFQDAVYRRDAKALRKLVCYNARQSVADLCRTDLSGRRPLEVTKVTRNSYEFRVHVKDPNATAPRDPAEDSFYVLTMEDGHMRVDLLETTRYHSQTTKTKLSQPTFVPQKLSPAKVREIEAANPGR